MQLLTNRDNCPAEGGSVWRDFCSKIGEEDRQRKCVLCSSISERTISATIICYPISLFVCCLRGLNHMKVISCETFSWLHQWFHKQQPNAVEGSLRKKKSLYLFLPTQLSSLSTIDLWHTHWYKKSGCPHIWTTSEEWALHKLMKVKGGRFRFCTERSRHFSERERGKERQREREREQQVVLSVLMFTSCHR